MAKELQIKLRRVTGSKQDYVVTDAVIASDYTVQEAAEIVDTVLCNPEFVSEVAPDSTTCYNVVETEDGYETSIVSEGMPNERCLVEILRSAIQFHHSLQMIHWGAKGSGCRELHSFTDSYSYTVSWQIDRLGELYVEYLKSVPNILSYTYYPLPNVESGFTNEEGTGIVQQLIKNYVETLEFYYDNFSHDVQGLFDDWIREWKQNANYILERALIPAEHNAVI